MRMITTVIKLSFGGLPVSCQEVFMVTTSVFALATSLCEEPEATLTVLADLR